MPPHLSVTVDTIKDSENAAYEDLLYAVNNGVKLPGWSVAKLKKLVAYDCEVVFALWRRNGIQNLTMGALPYLDAKRQINILGGQY